MAFSVSTGALGRGIGFVVYHGSWAGNTNACGLNGDFNFESTIGDTAVQELWGVDGSFNSGSISCPKDTTITWRASGFSECLSQLKHGSYSSDKTYADLAIFPTGLTPGTPTGVSCPVSGSVTPKTVESVGTVTAEYRVQGTGTWLVGPTIATGLSGSGTTALGGTLTGLSPNTTYEARYHINRNTTNVPDAYSAIGTFTTASVATTLIGPPVMELTFDMPAPTIPIGTIIVAPFMDIRFDMSNDKQPNSIVIAGTRIITRNVLMGGNIERDFHMS